MRKTLLSLAFVAALMTSCKGETKEETGEAVDAAATEVTEAIDTAAAEVDSATTTAVEAVDKTVEAGKDAAAGAAKVEEVAKDGKEAAKK